MKTIIAGSRAIVQIRHVLKAMNDAWDIACIDPTIIISGGAQGVDKLGERWAKLMGIPVQRFPAAWDIYGKAAGIYRNRIMAQRADALVAIWDGKSRGTKNMIEEARKRELKIYVHGVD
jgi:hypothetical protein